MGPSALAAGGAPITAFACCCVCAAVPSPVSQMQSRVASHTQSHPSNMQMQADSKRMWVLG